MSSGSLKNWLINVFIRFGVFHKGCARLATTHLFSPKILTGENDQRNSSFAVHHVRLEPFNHPFDILSLFSARDLSLGVRFTKEQQRLFASVATLLRKEMKAFLSLLSLRTRRDRDLRSPDTGEAISWCCEMIHPSLGGFLQPGRNLILTPR